MIKCIDCKYNKRAPQLGSTIKLCVIPLPPGIVREARIYEEQKYGCVLGVKKDD